MPSSINLESLFDRDLITKEEFTVATKAKADTDAKAKADTVAKAKADTDAKAKADTDAKAKADTKTKTKTDAKSKADTDAKADTKAKTKTKTDAKSKADTGTDAKTKTKVGTDAKAKNETVSKSMELNVKIENLGAFIGRNGSNFKKMIYQMKSAIIGKKSEITPDEWGSVQITLNFDKGEDNIIANYECDSKFCDIIEKVLLDFTELHKKDNVKFQKKKNQGKQLVFRIGAPHRFIGRMIGVGGSNVGQLKQDLSTLANVESIGRVMIEEQTKRFNGNFRNIGERDSDEYIMMFLNIKGTPDFELVQSIIEDFIKKHIRDDERDEDEDGEDEDGEDEDEDGEDEELFNGGW